MDDGYTVDNKAASVYTDPSPKIYAAGELNPFVMKGFETIGVELIQGSETNAENKTAGILIMEGDGVEKLPEMPAIIFNNNGRNELTEPLIAKKDPLFEYVDPVKMYISHGTKTPEVQGLETILSSGSSTLFRGGS